MNTHGIDNNLSDSDSDSDCGQYSYDSSANYLIINYTLMLINYVAYSQYSNTYMEIFS